MAKWRRITVAVPSQPGCWPPLLASVGYLPPTLPANFIETNVPRPTSPTLRTGITGVCALAAARGAATKKPTHPPRPPARIALASMNRKVLDSQTATHTPANPPQTAPTKSPVLLTDAPSADPRTAAAPVKPDTNKTSITAFKRILSSGGHVVARGVPPNTLHCKGVWRDPPNPVAAYPHRPRVQASTIAPRVSLLWDPRGH
jgi:hypothetical protein